MVAIELYDPARRDGDLECLAEDGLIYGDEFGRDLSELPIYSAFPVAMLSQNYWPEEVTNYDLVYRLEDGEKIVARGTVFGTTMEYRPFGDKIRSFKVGMFAIKEIL
ncbi:hypothetical protein CL616_01600 [archaeon]|nr:hypothetical protein [archaeon]|tara:strand:+ start:1352 stop:1672 length:321 start_codon:yes stop_codon:yes gene_type:complete